MNRTCTYDPLSAFMEHFAGAPAASKERAGDAGIPAGWASLAVEERLKLRIRDGNGVGLQRDLESAMERYSPLDIINTILLDGMRVVGELFGSGQMQLPFVLRSAETMKAAVSHLEQFLPRSGGARKGVIVLATVKGDVHDIGKNLVDIILSNNGYTVVNLGIKVPVDTMLAAVGEHGADALGMSGLLVKSTVVMRENLELMRNRGYTIPVILGGAALTRRYVEEDLRPLYEGELSYARDAFAGLAFMERIAGRAGESSGASVESSRAVPAKPRPQRISLRPGQTRHEKPPEGTLPAPLARSSVATDNPVPRPPFLGSRPVTDLRLERVFEYLNLAALIRGQWQVKRGKLSEDEYRLLLDRDVLPRLDGLKREVAQGTLFAPSVVYGYFPCNAEGNDLIVYRPRDLADEALASVWPRAEYPPDGLEEWRRFTFPRQEDDRRLCIADFFRPRASGSTDVVAFHVVTIGQDASRHTARLFAEHKYQDYLYLHGLSVECAEALAEFWHKTVREELGIAGKDAPDIARLFSQGYQGSRYSFGYPACPNLEDHEPLFDILRPERIGVTLTEEFQLNPEQSTSAIIVHHPEARYFSVKTSRA